MISIIIPFHNEENNITVLCEEIVLVLEQIKIKYETILVDDGSSDASKQEADDLSNKYSTIKTIHQRRRFGKGKALADGFEHVTGNIIIFMDGDLQDNPHDLPKFIAKINQGYDLVNGIRIKRKENSIIKAYSKLGNRFLKLFTQSPFTDINCGFKAIRIDVLKEIKLYGNNFRFLPLAAYYQGFKVTEIPVDNRVRQHGISKYGIAKPFIGFIDTITAFFLYRFSEKPLHFFGTIGGIFFAIGFIIALVLSIERIFFGVLLYRRPALLLAILLIIVGIQIAMTGIIGELIVFLNKKK